MKSMTKMTKKDIRTLFHSECPKKDCQLFDDIIVGNSVVNFLFVTHYWTIAVFVADDISIPKITEAIDWVSGFNMVYVVTNSSEPVSDFIKEILVSAGVGLINQGIKQDKIDAMYFPVCDYNWNRLINLDYKEIFCTAVRKDNPLGFMFTTDYTKYLVRKFMYHSNHPVTVQTIRNYAFGAHVIDHDYVRSSYSDPQGFTHVLTTLLKSARELWSHMSEQGYGKWHPGKYVAVIKRKAIKVSD